MLALGDLDILSSLCFFFFEFKENQCNTKLILYLFLTGQWFPCNMFMIIGYVINPPRGNWNLTLCLQEKKIAPLAVKTIAQIVDALAARYEAHNNGELQIDDTPWLGEQYNTWIAVSQAITLWQLRKWLIYLL